MPLIIISLRELERELKSLLSACLINEWDSDS